MKTSLLRPILLVTSLLAMVGAVGCASSPPVPDAGVAIGHRRLGATMSYERARAVIASALPAYTNVSGVLTANANGALANQDGVALAVNDQVLDLVGPAGQSSHADVGLYTVTQLGSGGTPWILTRSQGFQQGLVFSNMQVDVDAVGTLYGGASFKLVTPNPITVGTTALQFVQLPWRVGNGTILPGASMLSLHTALAVCPTNQAALSGLAITCDGVALSAAGQRALLVNQTTASQNGIWAVASGSWTRPADWFTGDTLPSGTMVEIGAAGTSYGQSTWKVTTTGAITIDTTSVALYPRFSTGTVTLAAGAGTISSLWCQTSTSQVVLRYNGAFSSPGSLRVSTQTAGAGVGSLAIASSSGADATPVQGTCVNW